jgi:hypothetical protein
LKNLAFLGFIIFAFDYWPCFSLDLGQFEILEDFLYPRPDLLLDLWPINLSKSIELMLIEVQGQGWTASSHKVH